MTRALLGLLQLGAAVAAVVPLTPSLVVSIYKRADRSDTDY